MAGSESAGGAGGTGIITGRGRRRPVAAESGRGRRRRPPRRRRVRGRAGTFRVRPHPMHGNAETAHRHRRADAWSRTRDTAIRAPLSPPLLSRAGAAHSHERFERTLGRAAVDRRRRRFRRPAARSGAMPATTSAAAALSTARSRRGPFSAREHLAQQRALVPCVAAHQLGGLRRARCRRSSGSILYSCSALVDQLVHSARRGRGQLVETVVTGEHHRPLGTERAERAEHARGHRRVGHAHRLGGGRAPGWRAGRGS